MAIRQTLPHSRTVAQPRRIRWGEQGVAWLFLLPAVIVFAYVTWYPMLIAVTYSFQRVTLTGETSWIGLANYQRMVADPLFFKAWRNIIDFTLLSLILGYLFPLGLALLVNEMRRAAGAFRLVYYLPTLIPATVGLLVWRQIYAPEGGVLNSLISQIGIAPQLWLQDPKLVKLAMIVIMTWAGAGGTLLIYIAALQEIPTEVYEAAELDGFSPTDRVRYIALPNLVPQMQILLVLQIIAVMQVFTEPLLLTAGGPANTTLTPVLASYKIAFSLNDFGLASAWSMSLLVVLSIFSIVYVWLTNRRPA